jgi:hypothetical protein
VYNWLLATDCGTWVYILSCIFPVNAFRASAAKRSFLIPGCRMAATINACDDVREAMNGGHTANSRCDHRFCSLRGCACARREAVPERPHLSGLQRGERCPDLPGRETGAAGVATSCRPHGATGYLAAERRCAISPASGISIRTVCYPLAVRRRRSATRRGLSDRVLKPLHPSNSAGDGSLSVRQG